jgi:hypothetical protein
MRLDTYTGWIWFCDLSFPLIKKYEIYYNPYMAWLQNTSALNTYSKHNAVANIGEV